MSACIHFPLQYLQYLRFWPTDQANPFLYTREEEENSEGKFNRLEKLLPRGQLATWPVSHLLQVSRNVSAGKYFSRKPLVAQRLAEICKIVLERILLACDSRPTMKTPYDRSTAEGQTPSEPNNMENTKRFTP